MDSFFILVIIGVVVLFWLNNPGVFSFGKSRPMTQEELDNLMYGHIQPELVCPHCKSEGKVRRKYITAHTGTIKSNLIGGVKGKIEQQAWELRCGNCLMTWHVT